MINQCVTQFELRSIQTHFFVLSSVRCDTHSIRKTIIWRTNASKMQLLCDQFHCACMSIAWSSKLKTIREKCQLCNSEHWGGAPVPGSKTLPPASQPTNRPINICVINSVYYPIYHRYRTPCSKDVRGWVYLNMVTVFPLYRWTIYHDQIGTHWHLPYIYTPILANADRKWGIFIGESSET